MYQKRITEITVFYYMGQISVRFRRTGPSTHYYDISSYKRGKRINALLGALASGDYLDIITCSNSGLYVSYIIR